MLALLALLSTPAPALEPVLDWTLSGAYWGAGAESTIKAGVRQPLWDRPGNLLLESTYLQANGSIMLTPAYAKGLVEVAFQPAAIFELRAGYGLIGFFDAFTAMLVYDDPAAVYDADANALRDRSTGWASRLKVEPTLRMKGGPVVFVGWSVFRWTVAHPGPTTDTGDYWLDPEFSLLSRLDAVTWDHNALLAGELRSQEHTVYVGGYGTFRQAPSTDDSTARVGPAVVWMPPGGHWTLYGICQLYLDDRVYTGVVPPYIGVRAAYSFNPP